MASFTERATLEVKDRSTAQIRKINAELKRLQATAASLRSIRIELTGIALARRQVQGLIRDLRALRTLTVSLRMSTASITAAQRQLSAFRRTAARPINVRVNYTAGRAPTAPAGVTTAPTATRTGLGGRRSTGRSLAGAALTGANLGGGLGLGMLGLGSLNPAFLAVASAAYIAAAALRGIAKETYKAERAELQLAVGATPEQQIIIRHALERYQKGQHPLDVTPAEFIQTAVGMLTDVRGRNAAERARAVGKITPLILDEILPLTFALNPKMTKEQALEGVNTLVKAMNIGSSDLTYASGELSKDGERVLRAMVKAKAINPLVDPERMRATVANMKTAAFTMDEDALAVTLSAAGDRGTRVGNEIYRAIQALSGAIDNKALLNSLKDLGVAAGGVPKTDRRGRPIPGSFQPGTMTITEMDMLKTNPYKWIDEILRPKILERAARAETAAEKAAGEARAAEEAQRPGATAEEIEEARAPLRSKIQTEIDKAFPTATMAARTAIAETIYNMEQRKSTLDQMRDITKQLAGGGMQKIFDVNWAAQLQQMITQLQSQSQGFNDFLKKELGIADTLKTMTDAMKGDPEAQKKAVEKGLELAKTIAPQFIGQELLIRGATMLWQAAQALYNWIPKKGQPGEEVPSGASMTAAGQALEQQIKFEQGVLDQLIKKLDLMEKNPRVTDAAKDAIRQRITDQQVMIDSLKKDLATSIAGELRAIIRPEPIPPRHEDVWGGAKTPTASELQGMLAPNIAAWSEIIVKGPSEFDRVFNQLPQQGTTAGTSMGSSAMETINGGASGAGASMGSSFLDTVRGGLAGLNLNVTATVAGQGAKPDAGARVAD